MLHTRFISPILVAVWALPAAGRQAKHAKMVDDRVQFDQRIALVESGLAFIQPRTRRARETLRWRLPVKTGNDILA